MAAEDLEPKMIHQFICEPLFKKLGRSDVILIPMTHRKGFHHTLLQFNKTTNKFYHLDSLRPNKKLSGQSFEDAKKLV